MESDFNTILKEYLKRERFRTGDEEIEHEWVKAISKVEEEKGLL